jgi:uncharacterized protein (DUF2267 family)
MPRGAEPSERARVPLRTLPNRTLRKRRSHVSATGLDVFDKTLQTTNIWLKEIMEEVGPDRQVAWHVLGATLHALRDRLPIDLAAHLGAQLPLLVRGLYYDQWKPAEVPLKIRTRDEFLEHVSTGLKQIRPVNVQQGVRAVLHVIDHHVNPEQVTKVREALPEAIRTLWPGPGKGGERAA